jgi:hypothetical protein
MVTGPQQHTETRGRSSAHHGVVTKAGHRRGNIEAPEKAGAGQDICTLAQTIFPEIRDLLPGPKPQTFARGSTPPTRLKPLATILLANNFGPTVIGCSLLPGSRAMSVMGMFRQLRQSGVARKALRYSSNSESNC